MDTGCVRSGAAAGEGDGVWEGKKRRDKAEV